MKRTIAALVLATVLCVPALAVAADCNRACLQQHLDTYLAAVAPTSPQPASCGWASARRRTPW